MRGKLLDGIGSGGERRIIPAHAGQTSTRSPIHTADADHPRACGANLFDGGLESDESGSSPRMRGKHRGPAQSQMADRIIPAHAGQTNMDDTVTLET